MIIFLFSSFSTNVASDLERVSSHEELRHLFRFHPNVGMSEDLLCERGAQSESEGRRSDMLRAELTPVVVRCIMVCHLSLLESRVHLARPHPYGASHAQHERGAER